MVEYLYENTEFQKYDKYGYTLHDWARAMGSGKIVYIIFS